MVGAAQRLQLGVGEHQRVGRKPHQERAVLMRQMLAQWKEGRDLVEIGAYKPGTNPALDLALACMPRIEAFLRQEISETSSLEETIALLDVVFQAGD